MESTNSPTGKLAIIGYTNLDEDRFPDGRVEVHTGGGGYFVAQAATQLLQDKVIFITKIGKDFDTALLKGINPQGIRKSLLTNTSRSIQTYLRDKDGKETRDIQLSEGTSGELGPSDITADDLEECEWVHVATMPPLQQRKCLLRVRELLPEVCISIDSDAYLFDDADLLAEVKKNFRLADVIFANRIEFSYLQDVTAELPCLVVKKDKDGAEMYEYGNRVAQVAAPQGVARNHTGAGDTFAGAYIVSKLRQNAGYRAGQVPVQGKDHIEQDETAALKAAALQFAVQTASDFVFA